jgi:hypothetical protein
VYSVLQYLSDKSDFSGQASWPARQQPVSRAGVLWCAAIGSSPDSRPRVLAYSAERPSARRPRPRPARRASTSAARSGLRTSGGRFPRLFRSQACSDARDNTAAVMAQRGPVRQAPERRSAGRGGTGARIRRRRRLPRQRVSLWTLFLRRPPSSAQVEPPKGNPFGRRTAGGSGGNPRAPGCAGNRAGHRQGPIVPGPSSTAAPRIPDSGRQRARTRRLVPRGARQARQAAPSRGR